MDKIKILTISLCMLVFFSGCLDRKSEPSENITRGLDYMVRGDYDKAEKLFSDMLLEDQENSLVLYYRALTYYKKSDFAAGLTDFEKLYDINKDFNFEGRYLWDVLTNCYNARKDYTKAIELSLFYVKKYPEDGNVKRAYNIIANSYLRLKEFDKSIANYQKVIELTGKGKTVLEIKTTIDAKGAIKFIEENSDYERKPLRMFADIQNEVDTLKKIEIARKTLELYPKSSLADEMQYQIARLYSVDGLNDFDQALKEYQLFLKNYPDSPLVKQVENSILGIEQKYDPDTGKLGGSIH